MTGSHCTALKGPLWKEGEEEEENCVVAGSARRPVKKFAHQKMPKK